MTSGVSWEGGGGFTVGIDAEAWRQVVIGRQGMVVPVDRHRRHAFGIERLVLTGFFRAHVLRLLRGKRVARAMLRGCGVNATHRRVVVSTHRSVE